MLDMGMERLRVKSDLLREALAEFLGTLVLTLCGTAMLASVFLGRVDGSAVVPLGWGLSLVVALFVCGGVSGGHVNPAATLAFATVGKFPWRKVLIYWAAQYLGAFVAAALLFMVYKDGLDKFDKGERSVPPMADATAHIFSTFPAPGISMVNCFADQVVATALLLIVISAITDERNMSVPKGLYPLAIGFSLTGIFYGFAQNCMNPLNPARDLGPRVFTAMAGWGSDVFSFNEYRWFWIPILGPHVGAIFGVWIYHLFVGIQWPVDGYDLNNDQSSAATVSTADLNQSGKDNLCFEDDSAKTSSAYDMPQSVNEGKGSSQ